MNRFVRKMHTSWEGYVLRSVGDLPSARIPVFIYGTAWKKNRTDNLVYLALKNGFRAIDTGAQPKHYREDLVGKGIRQAIREGIIRREEILVREDSVTVTAAVADVGREEEKLDIGTNQIHPSRWSECAQYSIRPDSVGNGTSARLCQVITL